MKRNVYIAAAWPYVNGSFHLGHVAGLIGADILARYHRLNGDDVLYVSGSDCHGTPISVAADKAGVSPREIADKYHAEAVRDFIDGMKFSYDNYTTTMTATHERVVQELFLDLHKKGLIVTKTEELPYSEVDKRFLPDRYIEGECPFCHFNPARGDQCDNCGNLIDPKELINPKSKISGDVPVWKESEHFYLRLGAMESELKEFVARSSPAWRPNAVAFTKGLIEGGLPDRAITRDTDWGIAIPLPGYETKRIYVWFEAVTGYLSASVEWAEKAGNSDAWKDWWENPNALHYYVHGKDNIPFHTVIWPMMLLGKGGLELPDVIVSSELYNLEGKQFSKSRNWVILIRDILDSFASDSVRHYLVQDGPERSDASFVWANFGQRHNSDLVGLWGNFANRILTLCVKNFGPAVPDAAYGPEEEKLLDFARAAYGEVGRLIGETRFREAERAALEVVAEGNRYLNDVAPWKLLETDPARAKAAIRACLQIAKASADLLAPFLPDGTAALAKMLNVTERGWSFSELPAGHAITAEPALLYARIEEDQIKEQQAKLPRE